MKYALAIFLLLPIALAQLPQDYWGYTYRNGTITANLPVDVLNLKTGEAVGVASNSEGLYLAHVPGNTGDRLSFKLCGVEAAQATWNGTEEPSVYLNLSSTTLANGQACSYDCACTSEHCSADFDGTGAWCAPTMSCAHNGIVYASGEVVDNYKCSDGKWVKVEVAPAPGPAPTIPKPPKLAIGVEAPAKLSIEQGSFEVISIGVINLGEAELSGVKLTADWPSRACSLLIAPTNLSLRVKEAKQFSVNVSVAPQATPATYELKFFVSTDQGVSNSTVVQLEVLALPTPTCPPCPKPTEWSECIQGKKTRTVWRCGPETNYACIPHTEEQSCAIPSIPWVIVVGAVVGIGVLIFVVLKFLLKLL